MRCFVSWEVSTKANKWLGQGLVRRQYSEFDARFGAAEVDLDSIKRAGPFIRMNDLVVGEG
jgi:peptide/nickel transport system substrate-binding protein